ncbi:MAG: substrate-binding domain-containing protein [Geminicoccaceae bacterium]|nr:substrate-binding domain-containing protein [Geminicoccaceae bacterium]
MRSLVGRLALGLAMAAGVAAPATAQLNDLVSDTAFRVCADPANLPFSNDRGEGFENEISQLFADALGRELQYTWFPQGMGFVRRTLLANRCDVIPGYAQGDELVLNTNHYYTSAYVLIAPAEGDLADVESLSDPRLEGRRIGVVAGTPPASHLARHGLLATTTGYKLMVDRRVESPVVDMLDDLTQGRLDIGVVWGPAGAPLAREMSEETALEVTPLLHEEGAPRMFYRITMGVRPGEDAWKRELNSLIRRLQPEIDAILRRYGVPLVDDMGTGLKAEASR